jgi:hypothetical protein
MVKNGLVSSINLKTQATHSCASSIIIKLASSRLTTLSLNSYGLVDLTNI